MSDTSVLTTFRAVSFNDLVLDDDVSKDGEASGEDSGGLSYHDPGAGYDLAAPPDVFALK